MADTRVCVVGAGPGGLCAVKELKEIGLQPFCYERDDKIGGVWYYTEKRRGTTQGAASYSTLVSNSSKQMSRFTDYPMPKHYPLYLPQNLYLEYLNNFAKHFDLLKHIQLSTTVVSIRKSADIPGKWIVVTRTDGGVEEKHVFDFVLVCVGFDQTPITPVIPGLDAFKGEVMHAHAYRTPSVLKGKRVLVVGKSNSAGDVACDAANVASETYLSVGDGTWLLPRIGKRGYPGDFVLQRFSFKSGAALARDTTRQLNERIDHKQYGLAGTKLPLFGGQFLLNDEIAYHLISGKVKIRRQLTQLTETGALFDDGKKIDNLDMIVFATGYGRSFPFLEKTLMPDSDEDMMLYKQVFPVDHQHHTIAFIGVFFTFGATPPIMELQTRWVARVFAGRQKLPKQEQMRKHTDRTKAMLKMTYNQVKYRFPATMYADELANEIGVRPKFWHIFLRDPRTAFQCYFGPAFPVQYRLMGPGAREWAWGATDQEWLDTFSATNAVIIPNKDSEASGLFNKMMKFSVLIVVLVLVFMWLPCFTVSSFSK